MLGLPKVVKFLAIPIIKGSDKVSKGMLTSSLISLSIDSNNSFFTTSSVKRCRKLSCSYCC